MPSELSVQRADTTPSEFRLGRRSTTGSESTEWSVQVRETVERLRGMDTAEHLASSSTFLEAVRRATSLGKTLALIEALLGSIPLAVPALPLSSAVMKLLQQRQSPTATGSARFSSDPVSCLAKEQFDELADEWRQETALTSSMSEIVLNAAYQRIIGMGWAAVPLIMEELSRSPDHWFWALRSITGANPVAPDQEGDLDAMTQAWLRWGRRIGLVHLAR